MLKDHKIRDEMRYISDFFKIIKNQSTSGGGEQTLENEYQKAGKRVMFEYFIDILISDNPNKLRKCSGVQIKPIYELNIGVSINTNLKKFLQKLRNVNNLTITSLVKYVNKILEKETKNKLNEEVKTAIKIGEKHHLEYIALVQVEICDQKCPCCGRICGLEGAHTHHMCKYGHQMRGFNGSYYQRSDGSKEASVTRCQQLSETDDIRYNGETIKWTKFKDNFKKKIVGGWSFQDATKQNDKKENQLRFQKAWFLAGPTYCKKNNLIYVDSNKSQNRKRVMTNIHFIIAVDESGSMSGQSWSNLIVSLTQLMERIKKMDNSNNLYKVTLIKFNKDATLVFQNQMPSKVNLDIKQSGGLTSFDPPFNLAAKIASKYITNATVVFIFMTDEWADSPLEGIKAMKNLQTNYPDKLLYRGIEFQAESQVFQVIKNELKGQTGVAWNPEELTRIFIKFVEHIVNRESA